MVLEFECGLKIILKIKDAGEEMEHMEAVS